MATSESILQMSLAQDKIFLQRLQYLLLQHARVVKAEDQSTAHHPQRSSYATQVLQNAQMMATQAAGTIVGGPALLGTVTMTDTGVTTSATDAAILQQVTDDWNTLAGADTGAPVPIPEGAVGTGGYYLPPGGVRYTPGGTQP